MEFEKIFNEILKKIDMGLLDFKGGFPAEQSKDYIYPRIDHTSWTEGFWTGILWLSYEITKKEKYKNEAEEHFLYFQNRLNNKIDIDTHDLGFLYTLSCVAQYKITGNESAKRIAIKAADLLILRYKKKGEFIQAWGALDDDKNSRLIIDCLLNLPLLYWASEVSRDNKYAFIAKKHLQTALFTIIRPDGSTHHTYFFDPKTGTPLKGITAQGYSDSSCWARGQAWAIYGIALSYAYTKNDSLIPIFKGVTECFISKLPVDHIPYWDMIFTSGNEPRDTSAATIAICGILEMLKYIDVPEYLEIADKMMMKLSEKYTTEKLSYSNGLLTNAMYSRPNGDQPECNIWGDYFYMEALMRYKNSNWNRYW